MAMRIRRYSAEHIPQYSRSRATLDATGHRHWARIAPANAMVIDFGVKKSSGECLNEIKRAVMTANFLTSFFGDW